MAQHTKRPRRTKTRIEAGRGDASSRPRTLWPAALLVAAALIAYGNALTGPFVMDDRGTIVDNANIRQLWPFTTALTGPPQSAVAGRPIVSLSLAINYALGGLSPWGYHAWNLGVHLLAALVLFGILRRMLPDVPAFICALLWLVHPLQTEVIDYVTQRTETMM